MNSYVLHSFANLMSLCRCNYFIIVFLCINLIRCYFQVHSSDDLLSFKFDSLEHIFILNSIILDKTYHFLNSLILNNYVLHSFTNLVSLCRCDYFIIIFSKANLTRCSFHVHAADDLLSFKSISLKHFFLQHLPTWFMWQLISMTRTFYDCSVLTLSLLSLSLTCININNGVIILYKCPKL